MIAASVPVEEPRVALPIDRLRVPSAPGLACASAGASTSAAVATRNKRRGLGSGFDLRANSPEFGRLAATEGSRAGRGARSPCRVGSGSLMLGGQHTGAGDRRQKTPSRVERPRKRDLLSRTPAPKNWAADSSRRYGR